MRLTWGVLGHSRRAYCAWLANPVSQRELEDAHLTNALSELQRPAAHTRRTDFSRSS